ncbi:hypothetical protein HDU79_006074 [Rhizoclosmatium sp. JEL0117]|nr:hypothetical protein HDU79_006074 [Rhizoclosmatium sp. JEL0117]
MHSATILLTLAAAIDAANIISDVGGDCATNVPDNVFSCKAGLVCVIKNAPPAATQINTLGGTCANPPSVLPTVVKDPSAYGNTKDFEGCVKDTTKACPLNGWSSDSVPYVCKADEKKWKSQDTTPLYVCHVDGSAASTVPAPVATINDVGGDCATNIPGKLFSCKSGLVCVIKNAPPAATQINTLGGTCANPLSVLPTVIKDPSAYGNTKDFEGCVKDTTKACPLNGWSSDSVPYVFKADEKKWKSQDTTPLYVCHVDGLSGSTETVATTRAAPATGLYSAALSVAVSTLVATAFAFVF